MTLWSSSCHVATLHDLSRKGPTIGEKHEGLHNTFVIVLWHVNLMYLSTSIYIHHFSCRHSCSCIGLLKYDFKWLQITWCSTVILENPSFGVVWQNKSLNLRSKPRINIFDEYAKWGRRIVTSQISDDPFKCAECDAPNLKWIVGSLFFCTVCTHLWKNHEVSHNFILFYSINKVVQVSHLLDKVLSANTCLRIYLCTKWSALLFCIV